MWTILSLGSAERREGRSPEPSRRPAKQCRVLRRRFRAVDTGFVLSDHADSPGLLETIETTGAEHVWAAPGHTDALARYLREFCSLDAQAVSAHRPAFDDDETA